MCRSLVTEGDHSHLSLQARIKLRIRRSQQLFSECLCGSLRIFIPLTLHTAGFIHYQNDISRCSGNDWGFGVVPGHVEIQRVLITVALGRGVFDYPLRVIGVRKWLNRGNRCRILRSQCGATGDTTCRSFVRERTLSSFCFRQCMGRSALNGRCRCQSRCRQRRRTGQGALIGIGIRQSHIAQILRAAIRNEEGVWDLVTLGICGLVLLALRIMVLAEHDAAARFYGLYLDTANIVRLLRSTGSCRETHLNGGWQSVVQLNFVINRCFADDDGNLGVFRHGTIILRLLRRDDDPNFNAISPFLIAIADQRRRGRRKSVIRYCIRHFAVEPLPAPRRTTLFGV